MAAPDAPDFVALAERLTAAIAAVEAVLAEPQFCETVAESLAAPVRALSAAAKEARDG